MFFARFSFDPSPPRSRPGLLIGLSLLTAIFASSSALAQKSKPAPPVYGYQVVHSYPHDPEAFTQGLVYKSGYLYESTGLQGQSTVRKVDLQTGRVLQQAGLPDALFGEGITVWEERLIGITWQSQFGYVLDVQSFKPLARFSYPGEGWGLTHNGQEIIMSDGTAELRFLDPNNLRELRRLRVSAAGKPVTQINELEWVEGEVWANIWQTDRIARIDPKSGQVTGWIDLSGLLSAAERRQSNADVLNGIAYDPQTRRIFVTGKLWPKLFEIKLRPKP
ncbi:glutaminyl-peptide cyclotransferase [Paucibacter oligotrophus]|uniref:Glutaminyl-peptide cyclotransferase n=1 Tax=Roseateles oligotrophus TaxID=1769250 RepID=A0A840L7Z7_9BURK|nr:glutaminyl-peptide cyclotransferase [Roseateles oligotrophus]MBB4844684.1 glutaminyl-peptide cyclotransferase [Roseateles oligotrophus]